jgi:hypothetical protein
MIGQLVGKIRMRDDRPAAEDIGGPSPQTDPGSIAQEPHSQVE